MKKFLALVLALVMTMSLVTISAGAEDFTDADKVNYAEAVEVMTALDVVGGYADGSFNPAGTLTRGAAAKIICNMILGPTTAEALATVEAPFADVPADHVFAGYIAYCVSEDIVSGYTDGTFRPADKLTGYAFMKMLLCALGYDKSIEGYDGANFAINVAKRALNIGLDDGLVGEFNGSKFLTREEACLYAFNALTATMVEYENNSTVQIGDVIISNSSKADEVKQGNYGKLYGCDDNTLQFAEKYFKSLTGKKSADAFGRPGTEWKVDKEVVGTYAGEADYVVVLDEAVTGADAAAKLTNLVKVVMDETDDDLNADHCINNAGVWMNGKNLADKAAVLTKVPAEAVAGTVIELFVADDDETVTDIVAYNYELAEIEKVSTKVSATAAKKGATTSIKLKDGATYYDVYEGTAANVLAGFDAETYVKGAMIVMVKGENGIIDSAIAETVAGKITSYKTNVHAVVDGTKYLAAGGASITGIDFDEEYTLYLDPNAFVLKVDGDTATSIADVYYVTGVFASTNSKGVATYYAETVSLTGETADLVIAEATYNALDDNDATTKFDAVNALKVLTLNDDDEYEAAAFDSSNADYDVYTKALPEDVKSDATSLALNSKVYVDDATAYVSVKTNADATVKEVKTAEGGMAMKKTNVTAIAITADGEKDALYVIYVGTGISSVVDTENVVYVTALSNEKNSATTYETSVYYMEDLLEDTITVVGQKDPGFYTYAINEDGYYELDSVDSTNTKVDEDYTGWMAIKFLDENLHNNTVTFKSGSKDLEDVKFGGATVIDLRDEDTLETVYTYEFVIDSVEELVDASEVAAGILTHVYVVDGEIVFISVVDDPLNKK